MVFVSPYTNAEFRAEFARCGLTQSLAVLGIALTTYGWRDFFATLKKENIYQIAAEYSAAVARYKPRQIAQPLRLN